MNFQYYCWSFLLIDVLYLATTGYCEILDDNDSFDESLEDLTTDDRVIIAPAKDAIIGFINRLMNTGYTSSKIALNRIQKASQRRRDFSEKLEDFLNDLPTYKKELPIIDQVPRAFDNPHKKISTLEVQDP